MPPQQPIALRHSRLLLGLVLLALGLQNVLWLVSLDVTGASWPDFGPVSAMGLAFAQSALAGLLIAWGRGWLLVRGLLAIGMILAAAVVAAQATSVSDQLRIRIWISFMLAHTAVVALPLMIARLAGLRLVTRGVVNASGIAARRPSVSRQYTIGELISLTTLVALLLAMARYLEAPPDSPLGLGLFALTLGAIPWACVTLALLPLAWRWPVLAAAFLCPLAGWLSSLTGFPPEDPGPLIGLCVVEGIVLLAVSFVVRAAGYELAWRSDEH